MTKFLYLCKWLGLFKISKILTQNNSVRILGYHCFSENEGVEWLPNFFISPETFRNRLDFLKNNNYRVLKLGPAIKLLKQKKIPQAATVITIDDGWATTKTIAHRILNQRSLPYTIYQTSYYSLKETPIFNMVVKYMFWKTSVDRISLQDLGVGNNHLTYLSDKKAAGKGMRQIIKYGQTKLNHLQRQKFLEKLSDRLKIDYSNLMNKRFLYLLSPLEISNLVNDGVDFQLHTHTHRLPVIKDKAIREIKQNRAYLEPLTGKSAEHLCYPDGLFYPDHIPFLKLAGIKTATTCWPGVNYSNANPFTLKRFIDHESKTQIKFEAEISGFLDVYYKFRVRSKNKIHVS